VVFTRITNHVNTGLMFTVFIYNAAAAARAASTASGAVIGKYIGVVQNMAAGYADEWVGDSMQVGVSFIIILGVLLIRPSGLFGTAKVERV
jgi:branched-chain amino acid transport system permease protein